MAHDYFTARTARYENNSTKLMELAQELRKLGYKVYTGKTERCKVSYHVQKDGMVTSFGFKEVPYHWFAGELEWGLFNDDTYKCPITVEDILSQMREGTKGDLEVWYLMEITDETKPF